MNRFFVIPVALSFLAAPLVGRAGQVAADERWHLDFGESCTAQFAGGHSVVGVQQRLDGSGRGVARLPHAESRLTFAGHESFGVTSQESFTLEAEFRTSSGRFATMLMCREGRRVHYSLILGRETGRLTLELWSWSRDRAMSRARLDDGEWHRVVAAYDATTRKMALIVDGAIDSVVPVSREFTGSKKPGLRLGDNLDPGVRQPFVGDIRNVRMRRGIPPLLSRHTQVERRLSQLEPADVDRQLEQWLRRMRRARPPRAASRIDWKLQAQALRRGVQDALGLWPPPYSGSRRRGRAPDAATDFASFVPELPLDVRRGGQLERATWKVTRVYWRTFERYYASGWLYEPRELADAHPAVLCPHGHWRDGARHPVVQSRCITLAAHGFVVLAVDSVHHYEPRVGLTPVSLMTWNNLRGLELLRSLPHVDATRIGCTGASGGGQQTYYLTGLVTGLAAAAPAVMACHFDEILLSSGVHCPCNFVTHLMRHADMPQMAAVFAPKPQIFLSVTGDWTKNFPRRGFPEIREIYRQFDALDRVAGRQWKSKHDYNRDMRNVMYEFFDRSLRAQPAGGHPWEQMPAAVVPKRELDALDRKGIPRDRSSVTREFRARLALSAQEAESATPAIALARLRALFGLEAPRSRAVRGPRAVRLETRAGSAWTVQTADEVDLPVLVLHPESRDPESSVVVLLHERGKAVGYTAEAARIEAALGRGQQVVLADVRYVGELDRAAAWRDLYGRFLGQDEGILAVRDLRTVLAALPEICGRDVDVDLVGIGTAGSTALFAAVLAPEGRVDRLVVPQLGPRYRDADRRPWISRILLHGDLDVAARLWHPRPIVRR